MAWRKYGKKKLARKYKKKTGMMGKYRVKSKLNNTKIYAFKRTVVPTSFTAAGDGVTATTKAYSHSLSDLPNYTEFTSLFDQYKITGIKVKCYPRTDEVVTAGSSSSFLYYAIDYDDANAPGATDLQQYQNCKTVRGDRPFYFYFVPRVANAVYSGSAFTSYGNTRQWIDAASSGVPHYGWKLYWNPTSFATGYDMVWTYYVKFRNVH